MNTNNDNTLESLVKIISDRLINVTSTEEISKTAAYHNIGKLIQHHLDNHEKTKAYGSYVFKTLAGKLSIGRNILYKTVQFYNMYPDHSKLNNRLTWTHFRILTSIKSLERREYYEKLIAESNISSRDLHALVRNEKINSQTSTPLLTREPGITQLYRVILKNDIPVLDLGFYEDLSPLLLTFIRKDIESLFYKAHENSQYIKITQTEKTFNFLRIKEKRDQLFTYKAHIVKIIDGDTIKARLDQGLGLHVTERIRLRNINAPDITTPEGQKAKAFIEQELQENPNIIIKTYARDKYDRYLADIYYSHTETDPHKIQTEGRFLNQQLLDKKHAERYYRY